MTDLSGPAYDAMIEAGLRLGESQLRYAVRRLFNHGATPEAISTIVETELAGERNRPRVASSPTITPPTPPDALAGHDPDIFG